MITGLFFGYNLKSDTQEKGEIIVSKPEARQIDVKTIAVVNLDEGIIKDDKIINYANDLINFTNENLISVSLEDARNGVEEGRYAGYVIIPATFSKNIQSINETPVESQIQYALCNHLTGESGLEALGNIYLLMDNLNNNVSYMYVDSILNEFHTAQDDVEEILKNGKAVSSAVNEVNPQDISARVEFPSEKQMEFSPEEVDFKGYIQNNSDLISDINKEYSDGYDKSEKEKENLTVAADSLKDNISKTNSKLKDINVEMDSEGNYVYDTELKSLSESLNQYNTGLDTSIDSIKNIVNNTDTILKDSQTAIEDVKKCYTDTVDYYNSSLETAISEIKDEITIGDYELLLKKEDLELGTKDEEIVTGEIIISYSKEKNNKYMLINEEGDIDISVLYKILNDMVENQRIQYKSKSKIDITDKGKILEKLIEILPKYDKDKTYIKNENYEEEETDEYQETEKSIFSSLTNLGNALISQSAILENFENDEISKINTEQIVQSVKESVVDKLSNNAKNVAKSISNEYEKETEVLSSFQNGLAAYNPFAYIDQQVIKAKNSELSMSTSELEKAIHNKDSKDKETMNTIYSQYGENIMMLRESLSSAVDSSNESVKEGLQEAKNTLSEKNGRNEELLGNFVEKLPYTRNGTLGNYRTYKFIVNPFESQNVSSQNTDFVKEDSPTIAKKEDIIPKRAVIYSIFVITGIVLIISIITITIGRKHKKNNNYNL